MDSSLNSCSPCPVYETANRQCNLMPCNPCLRRCSPKPKPCQIFIPPKSKRGVCEDLRRLNFFNVLGNVLTLLAVLFFLLTLLACLSGCSYLSKRLLKLTGTMHMELIISIPFLIMKVFLFELLIFHYITSHDKFPSKKKSTSEFSEFLTLPDDQKDVAELKELAKEEPKPEKESVDEGKSSKRGYPNLAMKGKQAREEERISPKSDKDTAALDSKEDHPPEEEVPFEEEEKKSSKVITDEDRRKEKRKIALDPGTKEKAVKFSDTKKDLKIAKHGEVPRSDPHFVRVSDRAETWLHRARYSIGARKGSKLQFGSEYGGKYPKGKKKLLFPYEYDPNKACKDASTSFFWNLFWGNL